jgi:TRAP-type C4-dicarboxylate transport system substrate-binding protein
MLINRGRRIAALAGLAAVTLLVAACSPEADGGSPEDEAANQTYVIKYSTQHTEDTPYSRATQEWAELVEERTDGRVTVEIFYSGALLDAAESLPGIADGRAEAGFIVDSMFQEALPLSTASSIPFDRPNGVAQALAFHELYETNDDFRAQWERAGVHILHFQPPAPAAIGSNEPIDSYTDLAGTKTRCIGYICDALQIIGANPVAIASNEIYEAMERGTIDAWTAYPFQDMLANQFQEVTNYVVDPGIGAYIQGATPINLDFWDALPEDIQTTLTDLSSEYYDIYIEHAAQLERETCAATTEAGVELSSFSESESNRWRDAVRDSIFASWSEQVSGTGVDAAAFYDEFLDAYSAAELETDYESLFGACAAGEI